MSQTIESVAILGGGFMGAGIAESASIAGVPVIIRELPEFIDAARARLEKSLGGAVKRGRLDAGQRDAALANITFTSDMKDVAGYDLVIEAVPENLDLKLSIMKSLDQIVSPDTILASNTSSIPIAQLGGMVSNPERVVGLHFFSPVPVMKLVEIVRALDTSDETVAAATQFAQRLGKHAIETKDRSGFIVNFLLTPYLMAAVRMFAEGFGQVAQPGARHLHRLAGRGRGSTHLGSPPSGNARGPVSPLILGFSSLPAVIAAPTEQISRISVRF